MTGAAQTDASQQESAMPKLRPAPDWYVTAWFNTPAPLTLADLRGKVVLVCAFQMLCPACVSHGLPQARRAAEIFDPADVAVVGLHTVFEHHDAMNPTALKAFLHEYRVTFPVGVDQPEGEGIPRTMRTYDMRATPTTLLIDREGMLRRHAVGCLPDMQLGAEIMALVSDRPPLGAAQPVEASGLCTPGGCD